MPMDLPYAADAEVSLLYDELVVRTNYLVSLGLGHVGPDVRFRQSGAATSV